MGAIEIATVVSRLASDFINGTPILFTGAGFSLLARDAKGRALPLGKALAKEIWILCHPTVPFNEEDTLQDVFQYALKRHRLEVSTFLRERLSVDPGSLPAAYGDVFALPWARAYTLNVDNLEVAVSLRFHPTRRPISTSATSIDRRTLVPARSTGKHLDVVHLNGTLEDLPDGVTFATMQYAERTLHPDPFYARLAGDLLTHPVVFVGTALDEAPLWQAILIRQQRGPRGTADLRPRSYLVVPKLAPARQELLRDYNVVWVQFDVGEFLSNLVAPVLSEFLRMAPTSSPTVLSSGHADSLPLVAELASAAPTATSEYLTGQEPIWADLTTGRAIRRTVDDEIHQIAAKHLAQTDKSLVLAITGTAASGKSTSLMRLALSLSSEGHRIAFIGREVDLGPDDITRLVARDTSLRALAIDDADRYGSSLSPLLDRLSANRPGLLTAIALRSSKVEARIQQRWMTHAMLCESVMPPLSDPDITALVRTLDANNRLGVLKGKSLAYQHEAFRKQATRQLLVAMIQATSGRRFEEKVVGEYTELNEAERRVYACVATASSAGFSLTTDEILLACGVPTNQEWNVLAGLVRRSLIVHPDPTRTNVYSARHREIARVLVDELIAQRQVRVPISGIVFAAASRVDPSARRNTRPWRLLKVFINHTFLKNMVDLGDAREIYASVEAMLSWDYQYLLQRGSLEVQVGDLTLAENFLGQALSLNPSDALVSTEYAHLQFRRALESPRSPQAQEYVDLAMEALEKQIRERGERDHYPYHVLGSQGLAWAKHAPLGRDEKQRLLRELVALLEEAKQRHPSVAGLIQLHVDLQKELMMTTVS